MARAWRIEYEGALYHVFSRGNEQRPIVIDDEDRQWESVPLLVTNLLKHPVGSFES